MNTRNDQLSDRMRLHRDIIRKRVRFGFLLAAGLFGVLALRLIYVQVVKHSYWLGEAQKVAKHKKVLLSQRGMILDRNGVPLAINVQVGDVVVDPSIIADPDAFAADIAKYLPNHTAEGIAAQVRDAQSKRSGKGKSIRYLIIAKGVSYDHIADLQSAFDDEKKLHNKQASLPVTLTGYSVNTRWVRSYPKGSLACQVLGFVSKHKDADGNETFVGQYGIEKSMNDLLAGKDGYVIHDTDADGREIPDTEIAHADPVNGRDVQLTIDVHVQSYAEEALARSVSEHHAEWGTCIVIDPKTGDVLAMANMPQFDPNRLKGSEYVQWDNHAVSDLYEPGSTLKSVTLAATLDALGMAEQNTRVNCEGETVIGGHTIHCAKDPPYYGVHGDEDMRDVLKNSCNIGAAHYAMKLGSNKLYEYERAFGFLEKPSIELPDLQCSRLKSPDEKPWAQIRLANIGFGQGISVTPLQLVLAYSTLANGGSRVYPHIIKGIQTNDKPVQVVKTEVAKTLLSFMQTVVDDGTGKAASLEGFNIGGKTGSAQVAENGHYGDHYIGSFVGVVPITDPRLVVLCAVAKPVGAYWGAVVAAPVVHDVAQQSLLYMNVARDAPEKTEKGVSTGAFAAVDQTPAATSTATSEAPAPAFATQTSDSPNTAQSASPTSKKKKHHHKVEPAADEDTAPPVHKHHHVVKNTDDDQTNTDADKPVVKHHKKHVTTDDTNTNTDADTPKPSTHRRHHKVTQDDQAAKDDQQAATPAPTHKKRHHKKKVVDTPPDGNAD